MSDNQLGLFAVGTFSHKTEKATVQEVVNKWFYNFAENFALDDEFYYDDVMRVYEEVKNNPEHELRKSFEVDGKLVKLLKPYLSKAVAEYNKNESATRTIKNCGQHGMRITEKKKKNTANQNTPVPTETTEKAEKPKKTKTTKKSNS